MENIFRSLQKFERKNSSVHLFATANDNAAFRNFVAVSNSFAFRSFVADNEEFQKRFSSSSALMNPHENAEKDCESS